MKRKENLVIKVVSQMKEYREGTFIKFFSEKRNDISEMSHVFKAVVVRIIKYSSLAQET